MRNPPRGHSDEKGQAPPTPEHGSGELYTLVRGLQRQLHLQRTALDAVHSQARQTEMKLRQVSAALMTSQEMERKRIASELHDSVGAALTSLSFGVSGAIEAVRSGDSADAAARLQKLRQHVKDTLEEVRRIAMDLRPAILDDLGIVGTLSWFFREFRAIYPKIALRPAVGVLEDDVAVTLRTPIYRVVQEALNNIVKHAGASEVQVVLARRGSSIVLEINDNGRGFAAGVLGAQPSSFQSGMGLTGMRDRVEFSGGDFAMTSTPGQGTRVSACWPVSSNEGAAGSSDAKHKGAGPL
jgi:signal transduction histidine kinase